MQTSRDPTGVLQKVINLKVVNCLWLKVNSSCLMKNIVSELNNLHQKFFCFNLGHILQFYFSKQLTDYLTVLFRFTIIDLVCWSENVAHHLHDTLYLCIVEDYNIFSTNSLVVHCIFKTFSDELVML